MVHILLFTQDIILNPKQRPKSFLSRTQRLGKHTIHRVPLSGVCFKSISIKLSDRDNVCTLANFCRSTSNYLHNMERTALDLSNRTRNKPNVTANRCDTTLDHQSHYYMYILRCFRVAASARKCSTRSGI